MKSSILATALSITALTLAVPFAGTGSTPERSHTVFTKRDLSCNNVEACFCYGDNAEDIVQQANNEGQLSIPVNNNWESLYQSNDCVLWGKANDGETSSYAQDIGAGANNIVNECPYDSGSNTAGGNGNFQLWLASTSCNPQ